MKIVAAAELTTVVLGLKTVGAVHLIPGLHLWLLVEKLQPGMGLRMLLRVWYSHSLLLNLKRTLDGERWPLLVNGQ